jgi:hypothetical protein
MKKALEREHTKWTVPEPKQVNAFQKETMRLPETPKKKDQIDFSFLDREIFKQKMNKRGTLEVIRLPKKGRKRDE